MSGLYRSISADVLALWSATWNVDPSVVPAYWRSNSTDPAPSPVAFAHFMRNEIDFGRETVLGYGGGAGHNERAQFGSVLLRIFTARDVGNEDDALDYLGLATNAFRSKRAAGSYAGGSELSFVGPGSGFDAGPTEDGNWFFRGVLVVFEYRFRG